MSGSEKVIVHFEFKCFCQKYRNFVQVEIIMKYYLLCLLSAVLISSSSRSQNLIHSKMQTLDTIKTESHIKGLKIALLYRKADAISGKIPVLFIHGASFPSSLSFGFMMGGKSWMDELAQNGIESFALDFLGYGNSDRYPEMYNNNPLGTPLGRATDVYKDVDLAVDLVLKKTGTNKVDLVAHSWGGSVAMLYVSNFPYKIILQVLYAPSIAGHDSSALAPVDSVYDEMTPHDRLAMMDQLTPEKLRPAVETDMGDIWKQKWLSSDPLTKTNPRTGVVRFPAGPDQDINDLTQGKAYYEPSLIKVPVLIVRGEWVTYPTNAAAGDLFGQ